MVINKLIERNQFPTPDFNVCGADNNPVNWWEKIRNLKHNDLESLSTVPSLISDRYFGARTGKRNVNGFIAFLSSNVCLQNPRCNYCPLRFHCNYYKINLETKSYPTFADMFCGAGGLSLGFEQAGLKPEIANDIDPWFMATYSFNRPGGSCQMYAGDVRDFLSMQTDKGLTVDLVAGGVPCQSFSNANRQRNLNDPRDSLYADLLKTAGLLTPRALLIENVSGMLKMFDGIIEDLDRLNYSAQHVVLEASDFAIPQYRKRLFFIAFSNQYYTDALKRSKRTIENILSFRSNYKISLYDAISDLPRLEAYNIRNDTSFNNDLSGRNIIYHSLKNASDYVKDINQSREWVSLFNHKARFNNERDVQIFGKLQEGENSLADSIKELMPYSNRNHVFKDKYYKLKYKDVCKTITAHMRYDCNMYIHPKQSRGLTAREAARIQGFPDDYVFTGNFQRLYQQVGNAVPPPLAKIIGESLKNNI